MREFIYARKRRVIFTSPQGLAQTGATPDTLRRMIKQHREGEIRIHMIKVFKLGDVETIHNFELKMEEAA